MVRSDRQPELFDRGLCRSGTVQSDLCRDLPRDGDSAAALVLMGILWGLAGGPAASRIVENAPEGERGTGSSLMAVCIYLGSVFGTALYATIFTFATSPDGTVLAFADLSLATFLIGFHFTILAGIGLAVLAVILSALVREPKSRKRT